MAYFSGNTSDLSDYGSFHDSQLNRNLVVSAALELVKIEMSVKSVSGRTISAGSNSKRHIDRLNEYAEIIEDALKIKKDND